MEMTKRGVPGVWTYGFYDGWVPNYMFFIAHTHNAIGRFYEVQSYGPDNYEVRPGATTTSREWFRRTRRCRRSSGARATTPTSRSRRSCSRSTTSRRTRSSTSRTTGSRTSAPSQKGKDGPTYGWVIPATQRRKADAADAVNELRRQGLEIHTARPARSRPGTSTSRPGDYIIRGDQPYRTLADMYFSLQNYPPANPRPYDDTGWTFQFMRNVTLTAGQRQERARRSR